MMESRLESIEQLKPQLVPVPKCRYTHHRNRAGELPFCKVHVIERIVCGPGGHFCLQCTPFWGEKCGICGVERFACSC